MNIRKLSCGLTLLIAAALVLNGCAGGNSVAGAVGVPNTVVSTSPANKATQVSPQTAITATFSASIQSSSLNSGSFTVSSPAGPIAGVVSYSNSNFVATFQPSAPLPLNTVITATLSATIQDSPTPSRSAHPLFSSSYVWTFMTAGNDAAPTVASTTPAAFATGVSPSSSVAVTFSKPMNADSINGGTFTLAAGSGPKARKLIALGSTITYSNSVATLSPTSPLSLNTVYTATVTTGVTDVAGTPMGAQYSWTFTTSATDIAPLVKSTVPAQGATGASLSSELSVTFSEAMNYVTITGTSFSVAPAAGSAISATVRYSNDVATLLPTAALTPNTVYTATLTTAITDVDGTPLASNYQWTFTTSATDIAPVVLTTTPAPNALGVSISSNLTVTFSESMHTSTINSTNLTLVAQGGASVPMTVYYANGVAVMGPTNSLTPGTTYTATVSGLVQDVANTPMGANYTWSFTTGVQDANPTVVSTNPPNMSLGAGLNSPVTATFSESMNGSTITGTDFTLVPAGGSAVSATVTYSNGMATLTPTVSLLAGTTYTAMLDTSIQDVAGTPLHNPYQWTFTTGVSPSSRAPKGN